MAAHAARTAPALLVIAVATTLVLAVGNLGALAAASHAVCTYGTEPGTTCGEALWLLGYPA